MTRVLTRMNLAEGRALASRMSRRCCREKCARVAIAEGRRFSLRMTSSKRVSSMSPVSPCRVLADREHGREEGRCRAGSSFTGGERHDDRSPTSKSDYDRYVTYGPL